MNTKEQMQRDLKMFMQKKLEAEKSAIRMAMAAIKNKEIEVRHELDENQVLNVIKKQIKEHKDSLSYLKEDKQDEIEKYNTYISVLQSYLPEEMSREEAEKIIKETLASANITEKKQMGNAMKTIMPILKGKIDGNVVKEIVNTILK